MSNPQQVAASIEHHGSDQHQEQQQREQNVDNNNQQGNVKYDGNNQQKQIPQAQVNNKENNQQQHVQYAQVNNQMELQNQQQQHYQQQQQQQHQHQQQQHQPQQPQKHYNNNPNPDPIEQQHHNNNPSPANNQQQQGELPQSIDNQQQQQQQIKNKSQQQQQKDKDSYINKLQIYLNKVKTDLNNKILQFQQLTQDNKKTKQTLKKIRFDFLSTKQQLSTLNQHKSQLQKQNQSLTKTNTQLNQQLQTFKQAGDINFYKNKIIQLQKLLQIQKKQLYIKTNMIDQKDQLNSSLKNPINKVQILKLLEKYQNQNRQLTQKYSQITQINTQLLNTNKANQQTIKQLKITQTENAQILASQKYKLLQLQQQFTNKQQQFQNKIKQLQQNLQQLLTDKQNQKHTTDSHNLSSKKIIKSPQEQYGIKILNPIQQRNLIMREYIDLQIKYQSLTEELNNLRQRHYNTLRQLKNITLTHVPKKDLSQLYKKYVKLRKCLENSLINQENLRKELLKFSNNYGDKISEENQGENMSKGEAQRQAFSKYKSSVLEEPQNEVNKIDKIIQKSSDSQKQLFTLKQQLQTKQKLIRTQKLIKQKDQKIILLEKDNQKNKNLIQLYDTELTYKNNEIQLLRKAQQQAVEKIFDFEKNFISKAEQQQLTTMIEQNKMVNQILEIKNIQALKQNAILKSEKQNLTELYNDLKNMYEDLLNREPQLQSQQNKQHQQKQGAAMEIEHNKPCNQCLQREQKLKNLTFSQVETQTQGLSEIYFKQIKELLTVLRKFPKKVDNITGILQSQKSTIHEVKKRYDQVMQAYGAKYRQLQQEKKANDQWRLKQKDQIRQEFQQIRQMLLNERLITALRKAKSLIEFYEQNAPEAEGDQNIQQGEEQEGNQKPNPNAEQPIVEEEKQNV